VRRANLDVPADRVDHQWQDAGMIDQVQERLVVCQRVPERERVVRADSPGLPRNGGNLVNGSQQPIQLIRREELFDQDEALLLEVPTLLVGHRNRPGRSGDSHAPRLHDLP
jgi:hypothetical protein